MGDHVTRGSNTHVDEAEASDEWRDRQITAVEKRDERRTIQGMPPLERAPASKPES
jgi:hypothetical protein